MRRLVSLRVRRALSHGSISQMLPEERYVGSIEEDFQRRLDSLAEAVSSGQSSFLEFAQRSEMRRNVTIRFVKPVMEVIGLDLRRYGPFKPNDLASIPAANAEVLLANGEAVLVHTRD